MLFSHLYGHTNYDKNWIFGIVSIHQFCSGKNSGGIQGHYKIYVFFAQLWQRTEQTTYGEDEHLRWWVVEEEYTAI